MTGLDIPGAWVPKKATPKDSGTSPLTIADVSAAAALGAVPSPGVVEPPTASVEALFERAAHLEQIGQHEEAISTRPDLDQGGPLAHWRCAACVLRPGLSVSAGDTARLACAVRFGCLEVLSAEVLSSE